MIYSTLYGFTWKAWILTLKPTNCFILSIQKLNMSFWKGRLINALQFLRQIVHKLIATFEFERTIFESVLLRGWIFINKNIIERSNSKVAFNLCSIGRGNRCALSNIIIFIGTYRPWPSKMRFSGVNITTKRRSTLS